MNPIDLDNAARAAKAIKDFLDDPDDQELVAGMVEGETQFFELIDRVLGAIVDDEVMIVGLKVAIDELQKRKARVEARKKAKRGALEAAFLVADLPKIERPIATLSLGNRARQIVIIEDSKIPSKYWIESDPKLDKKALKSDLSAGAIVPGAELDNGGKQLNLRRA